MWQRFTSHLYLRIWLAVVATVVLLTFLAVAAWSLTSDPDALPIRTFELRDSHGDVLATAQARADRKIGDDLEFNFALEDGQTYQVLLSHPQQLLGSSHGTRPPFGFVWMLGLVSLAVALGAYPIIRRLTQRLEALQGGVERWGTGDLSARVQTDGSDEVAYLATRFNHAAERIETLMASHKSLLANASHELRSPLARIRMSLELLAPETAADARPHAALIRLNKQEIARSIKELDQLIDEILLASRLDNPASSNAEPFEAVDLTGLAAEECARVRAELVVGLKTSACRQIQEHSAIQVPANSIAAPADIESGYGPSEFAEPSIVVQGSSRLLRRLIRNLLENARRHGSAEVTLELGRCTRSPLDNQPMATIRVSDQGPGVAPEQRERIFEPFYRLPGSSERDGGVGLGLALVKSISQCHGGSVRCESRRGGGACFVVELPADPHNG